MDRQVARSRLRCPRRLDLPATFRTKENGDRQTAGQTSEEDLPQHRRHDGAREESEPQREVEPVQTRLHEFAKTRSGPEQRHACSVTGQRHRLEVERRTAAPTKRRLSGTITTVLPWWDSTLRTSNKPCASAPHSTPRRHRPRRPYPGTRGARVASAVGTSMAAHTRV